MTRLFTMETAAQLVEPWLVFDNPVNPLDMPKVLSLIDPLNQRLGSTPRPGCQETDDAAPGGAPESSRWHLPCIGHEAKLTSGGSPHPGLRRRSAP